MRVIILSFILLLCSCCPVDSSNSLIEKEDEIVINCSNKYRIYQDNYGTTTILYEFELHGHIFLANPWNDYSVIHAPWCTCKQIQSTTTESNFESNSYF